MTAIPPHRPRSPWAGNLPATDATHAPVRQSLTRYYASRTDSTRTRKARREAKAMRQARRLATPSYALSHLAPIRLLEA